MSITPQLQAAARGTYRRLFRAAKSTFRGDIPVCTDKIRNEYRVGRSISDARAYTERTELGNEVARFLVENVVQGEKTEEDIWRLKITPNTELGNNDTIKKCLDNTNSRDSLNRSNAPMNWHSASRLNFSELKRLHKERELPVLNEADIKESFVRGGGPGGQSINKTENCVQLLHVPTGIRVNCQETRSLELNRRIARKLLLEKLDRLQNPGLSKGDIQRARMNERERQKRKKRRKKEKQRLQEIPDGE